MARYDDDYDTPNRQRDLVLSVNEFCFLQNKTNGTIKTYTGPITMTISGQENLVVFDAKTKRFKETQDFDRARQLFVSAPEGWYIVLKNPAIDNSHPEQAKAVNSPELEIGHKINIPGPTSFSLFPGQMTRVIQGHRLRSNQYLLARVYDAEAAKSANATVIDAEGNEVKAKQEDYFVGQMLVIKGTEVSFYIPPTGIEVIPLNNNTYVRDAVTLERLEYAILKDEDGEKRYIHGPAVVFPKPTETFLTNDNKELIFKALELSPISGIYVKVIAEYDENGTHHPIGEELFITGKDQMIYYPRPEHAMIQYDGKYMHHAIAIPEGEGRYILDRLSGKIKTVKGPLMYLPDPRTEVVVKRKLTYKECELMYPGNTEVLAYNTGLQENVNDRKYAATVDALTLNTARVTNAFQIDSEFSRGTTFTKPRTITLDTKYDGVVTIDVWTGYAINIISKSGKREVVLGPTTRLLNYDETIEAMELSTGKPKTTDNLFRTGFLRVENNKVSDIIKAETSDFVEVNIKVSYCVNFLEEYKDKWFSVENYVKYLTDHMRSLLKREIKKYSIQEFYNNSTDIVRNIVLNIDEDSTTIGRTFEENGMFVYDVDVLSINVDPYFANIFERHQDEIVQKTLDLANAEAQYEVSKKLNEFALKEAELDNQKRLKIAEYNHQLTIDNMNKEELIAEKQHVIEKAAAQARYDAQELLNAIQAEELKRNKAQTDAVIDKQRDIAAIEKAKQESYANTIKTIVEAIGPDLVAALTARANADILDSATKHMSPYAIAKDEAVADTINTLLRGTTLENVVENITN